MRKGKLKRNKPKLGVPQLWAEDFCASTFLRIVYPNGWVEVSDYNDYGPIWNQSLYSSSDQAKAVDLLLHQTSNVEFICNLE